MKCDCRRYVTQQARMLLKIYKSKENVCIYCLAEQNHVCYSELLDKYMGIYDCRSCIQDKNKERLRRRLLGLGD